MTIAGGLRRGPGKYCVPIDAPHLASGVYFGRLFTGSASLTRTIILARYAAPGGASARSACPRALNAEARFRSREYPVFTLFSNGLAGA
jgi:hypothetical protein